MDLTTQLSSIFFSIVIGTLFSITFEFVYLKLNIEGVVYKLFYNFLYTFIFALIYYFGLLYINNGILHIYLILTVLISFIVSEIILSRLIIKR